MAVVETERHGQVLVVRMNRPDRLNALNTEMRTELARIWTKVEQIRAKQAAKPRNSPLPGPSEGAKP